MSGSASTSKKIVCRLFLRVPGFPVEVLCLCQKFQFKVRKGVVGPNFVVLQTSRVPQRESDPAAGLNVLRLLVVWLSQADSSVAMRRLLGRKKKSKGGKNAERTSKEEARPDDEDDDCYSCRFSIDGTYCSNQTGSEVKPKPFFSIKKKEKKSNTKMRVVSIVDSPPQLERTNRLPPQLPSGSTDKHDRHSTSKKSCCRKQKPLSDNNFFLEGSLIQANIATGSVSSLSTPEDAATRGGSDKGMAKNSGTSTAPTIATSDICEHQQHEFQWFPGAVALSVLEHRKGATLSALLVPAPERLVRQSCIRHLQMHMPASTLDTTLSTDGRPVDVDAFDMYLNNDDSSSVLMRNHLKAGQLIKEFVQAENYDGAIAIAKVLWQREKTEGNDPVAASTLSRQLTLLCLAAGRSRDAANYSTDAAQSIASLTTDESIQTQAQSVDAVEILVVHGLMLFGTNRTGQAIKTWREAIHMAIAVNGYQDYTVAQLLNGIGVVHLESGDVKSSLRSLEESLELQRTVLRSSGSVASTASFHSCAQAVVDDVIFGLAVTMGNLATACERDEQFDRAISLLEESMTLFQSMLVDTDGMQEIVNKNLERLEETRQKREFLLDDTTRTSFEDYYDYLSDNEGDVARSSGVSGDSSGLNDSPGSIVGSNNSEDEGSVDSGRSISLFGDGDGIPSRKLAVKLTMEQRDNHDFLLLGSLSAEISAEERVRETVLTWFGKRVDDDSSSDNAPLVTFDLEEIDRGNSSVYPPPINEAIAVDQNTGAVVDADLQLNAIHKQAMRHLDDNQIDEALELISSALKSHRQKYGEVHHLVGTALHNIGMVYFFAKRYSEALESFQDAIRVRVKALGPDHPDIQTSRTKVALIYLATGNLSKASETFRGIQAKYLEVLGFGHPQLAKIHNNVGCCAYEFGDLESALHCFEMAYEFQSRLLEDRDEFESPDDHEIMSLATANSLCNMAFLYAKLEGYMHAADLYRRAIDILERHVPRNHHRVVEVRENIDYLVQKCGVVVTERGDENSDNICSDSQRGGTCCGDLSVGYFSSCFL